ncbi:MAG TPA: heavy metal-binding protein [Sphaerochaeta sp.]|nr:MAG: heavy metal-binding protein [Spirochaetes bacterium GWC2_52_13]OHD62640.1 MAG: heavy metal-binding protein [Spirochaetes bacterium GWF2_52_7]PKL10895.1 MAG: heavy metal-binding protein [Spirochaetae bacterium HGW-Spirochaetae-8]PKL21989.1 MAG: heavy metal-binding protein [Spirochaetae bacterium HGW-Spirochaetae-4]HCG62728.1 heavy metal-binding protein [Sphaerochaeta sp.]
MKHITLQLETLTCPSCMAKIDGMMKKTDGVVKAEVLFNSSRVKAEIDESIVSTAQVKQRIEALGYKVLGEK